MNREERIERARRMAAEHAPQPEDQLRKTANRLLQRLATMGASQAQRSVVAIEESGRGQYLVPAQSPAAWQEAVELARLVTIGRARRRDTVTSGEIRWAIHDELRKLVDNATLTDLATAVSRQSDGVMLGSLIVDSDTGVPSDDFLLAAMELGFEAPAHDLQRQVYDHFR